MARFSCKHPNCPSRSFSSVEQAIDHVHSLQHFPKDQKLCVVPECHKKAISKLSRHIRTSHPKLCKFSCDLCQKVFVRDRDRQMHTDNGHSEKKARKKVRQKKVRQDKVRQKKVASIKEAKVVYTELDFRSPVKVKELNIFINNNLQPTKAFNKEMKRNVGQICKFLQKHMKLKPNQIVKGGSLGKGTAIKGKSDIDLVLVLNEVINAADLREKIGRKKKEILELLTGSTQTRFKIVPDSVSETRFSVKFSVAGLEDNTDVDLLPTFHFQGLDDLYKEMKNADSQTIDYYSAALVQQQVGFVIRYPPNVKNLIRLVKYWKKEQIPSQAGQLIPTSYVIELITIHLWEKNKSTCKKGRFNTLKAFHCVMEALKNYHDLKVVWAENYSENMIPSDMKDERPLVMDPANPMNNICARFSWTEISDAAKKVLDSPMMKGVTSHTGWK